MKRLLYLIIVSLTALQVGGQTCLVDKIDHSPIPFAQIVNEKGAVIGVTDVNGMFPKLTNVRTITVQHISYHTEKFTVAEIEKKKQVYLSPMAYEIGAANVWAQKVEYVRLKGYFRSYQLNDSCLKYYRDGIVEFHVSTKGKSGKRAVLEGRTLKNQQLIDRDKVRSNSVIDKYIMVPYLEDKTLIEEVKNHCLLVKEGAVSLLCANDTAIGIVKRDSLRGICRIEYDALALQKNRIGTLFGYTTRLDSYYQTESYQMNEEYQSYMDLINKKSYRKLFYKHKKDKREQQIEVIDELYIWEHEYVTKDEMKSNVKNQETAAALSADAPYWEKASIPAMSEYLKDMIENRLVLETEK